MGLYGVQRWGEGITLDLGDGLAELVALGEHGLAALGDELIEAVREAGRALSQLVEAEADAGQAVGHGDAGKRLAQGADGER